MAFDELPDLLVLVSFDLEYVDGGWPGLSQHVS
jgi:hypothetical protein